VEEAVRLIKEAMKLVAIDPKTGLLDMDSINVGKTAREREESMNLKNQLYSLLNRKLNETGRGRVDSIYKGDLLEEFRQLNRSTIPESEFDAALDELLDDHQRIHIKNSVIHFERSR
jgi:DNA replicative helicase MCM subunit Mcm2 (Cdc46/Mcm family)